VTRVGVVIFPGANCDRDVEHVLSEVLGAKTVRLWHKDRDLAGVDAVVLPGGFTYGDYLRVGAIAKESPIMGEVRRFAERGGPVLGICNGFQILCEARLLPGALLRNRSLRFVCKHIHLRFEGRKTPFTHDLAEGQVLEMAIAHGMGNYYADEATLHRLEGDGRVIFRYCNERGEATAAANPNGSCRSIAGICNERGNVLGLMPHPERGSERELGCEDGRAIFASFVHGVHR
jgi:phosphoribosylformylglycinamidine synthase